MADSAYKTFPARFASKGVMARNADDTVPEGMYLNLANVEELTENTLTSRLGSILINRTGAVVNSLGLAVHSLGRLVGLNGNTWRYAGSGGVLNRRSGDTQGAYTAIAAGLSGQQWSSAVYRPTQSSYPYLFIADQARMLKDNGSFAAPQQWGIFQPRQPVQAQVQAPQLIVWAEQFGLGAFQFVNVNSPARTLVVNTTAVVNAVAGTVTTVTPASMANINTGQLLDIHYGPFEEQLYVISITATNFNVMFGQTFAGAAVITWYALSGTVNASTTATITYPAATFSMPGLGNFPNGTRTQPEDYINLNIFLDNPNNLQQINLLFDVGDGTFTQDYFVKSFLPALDQALISGTETAEQAAVNQVFATAVGLTEPSASNPSYLNTGDNTYNFMQIAMQNFASVGQADPNGVNFNWSDVNAMQIQIVTNTNGPVNVSFNNWFVSGGYGPDSFAGVGYDWIYTYYNAVTGAESNPCIPMSDVIPLTGTTYFQPRYPLPRREPVLLTLVPATDSQVTHIRVYRRGGTLSDNYLRVDEIPANSSSYLDQSTDADIETSDIVSFVNDVPVTSTLPVPVATTLTAALNPPSNGQVMTVAVADMTDISVAQQVTLGGIADPNQEIVIVISIAGGSFTAFVQNPHLAGDPVTAEAVYGQPCNLCAVAYNAMWFAGDTNNPHYLYYSTNFSPEAVGSPNFVEVGIPSDPITAIVPFQGTLYVATRDHWWAIGPQTGQAPTVYPTSAVHGVVAPFGWVATESEIWHQSIDGIRTFAGGSSVYRSQEIEFVFQGGTTPLVLADPNSLNMTVMSYWNNIVFISYVGVGGGRQRLMYHTVYKRYRNDTVPATSLYLEEDTNTLLYGDGNGLVHQDRVGSYDEESNGGLLALQPIAMNLLTAYMDQGGPKNQKNYAELTLDADTAGQAMQVTLLFNDGQTTLPIGTLQTTGRQKQNFNVNAGLGFQAYRLALQIAGNVNQRVTLYQADIRAVVLAETRVGFDTYWLKFGTDESKLCKQAYVEYTSVSTLTVSVYYDGATVPLFTTTMLAAPQRVSTWVRFPAVKFRLLRMVVTGTADFQVWPDSKFEVKPVCQTKGYSVMDMMP